MGYITPGTYTPLTEAQLKERVKNIMDELDQETITSVGVDVNYPVTTLIAELLPESRIEVLYNAPLMILPKVEKNYPHDSTVGDNVATEVPELDAASFRLPSDAIRLADVYCNGAVVGGTEYGAWVKPVTEFTALTSQKSARQAYRFARATVKNPGVSLVEGMTMYAYPYPVYKPATGAPTYGTVVLHYLSSGTDYEDLGEKAQEALCWDCASRVFSAMGMADNAAICKKQYEEIIK